MGTASTELRPRQFVLDYATLIVLFIAFAIIYFGTSPKQRDWNPEDPLIQWPYRESTVGDAAAFVRFPNLNTSYFFYGNLTLGFYIFA